MVRYINKDALVAEIERLKADALQKKSQCKRSGLERIMHQIGAYNKIISFINTLEVKEVDLDKAARNWEEKVYLEKGWQDEYGTPHAPFSEIGNAFREGAKVILKVQKGE